MKKKKKKKKKKQNRKKQKTKKGGWTRKYVGPPISTINKTMTHQDLHNTFNLTALREYCRENGLISSGKKTILIKRILKFLQTGEKEYPTKVGKKKKSESEPTEGENEKNAMETDDAQNNTNDTEKDTEKKWRLKI